MFLLIAAYAFVAFLSFFVIREYFRIENRKEKSRTGTFSKKEYETVKMAMYAVVLMTVLTVCAIIAVIVIAAERGLL